VILYEAVLDKNWADSPSASSIFSFAIEISRSISSRLLMEEGHFSFYEFRASCQQWKTTFPESVFFLARNKSDIF